MSWNTVEKFGHSMWGILHCDWYALCSAGDKLLYGHVPDHFPWCGMGSDYVRLVTALAVESVEWHLLVR